MIDLLFKLIRKCMRICIGGELDGQDIENEQFSFKVNPDDENSAVYYRQSTVIGKQTFYFWFSDTLAFFECINIAEKLSRQEYKY